MCSTFGIKQMKRRKSPQVTYQRAFLVTLGLLFSGVMVFGAVKEIDSISSWPVWAYFVCPSLFLFGVYLIYCGLVGSHKIVNSLVDRSTRQSESLIVMIVAFPVYMIMLLLEDRK